MSRKAKKSGPGSSRRKGPPPHRPPAAHWVSLQAANATSWRLQGGCRRDRGLSRKASQGFLQLPWNPEMEGQGGSSELGLLLKVLPGRGEARGRPKAPKRAVWPVGCGRDRRGRQQVTRGTEWDQGTWGTGARGQGTAGRTLSAEIRQGALESSPLDPSSSAPSARSLLGDFRQVSWPLRIPALSL